MLIKFASQGIPIPFSSGGVVDSEGHRIGLVGVNKSLELCQPL